MTALLQAEKELMTAELWKALKRLGKGHYDQSNYQQALTIHQLAKSIAEQISDKAGIAQSLNDIGAVQYSQGNYGLALEYFQRSLMLRKALGDRVNMASSLTNLGTVYVSQGNHRLAAEYYQKALVEFESLGHKLGIATVLQGVGNTYFYQGNYALAMENYEKALKCLEAVGHKVGVGILLNNIGNIHSKQRNYGLALDYHQKSLKLKEALSNKEGIAASLQNIGRIYQLQGRYDLALDYLQKSLTQYEAIGEKSAGEASTLGNIGVVYYLQGDYPRALEFAERAAVMAVQMDDRELLWDVRTDAGRAYRALNQPVQARRAFEDAIATIEEMRSQVAGGEQEQQRSFENKISPYHAMVELLVAQDKTSEALAYAERAKARVLLDVLQSGRSNITKAMTAQESENERRLRNELVSLNSQISREGQRPEPDQPRLADIRARLQNARLEYEAFQTSLYAVHPELRVQRGEARTITLEEAAGLLPEPESALLEYVVTEEKTYLFVLSKGKDINQRQVNLKVYALAIKQKELADLAATFRQQLARRDSNFRQAAIRLYDVLVKPALAELKTKQTLVIVPDGPLWELPFQALPDSSGRYLIEDHALSYAPSLAVLREMSQLRRKRADERAPSPTLLAMGNPTLGEQMVQRVKLVHRDEQLGPLPGAEKEVKAVAQLYGAAQSKVYIGAEAREDRLKAEAGRFSVLHLATHGILNDASPMYSQVVLAQSAEGASEDGLLEAWEIMKLDLKADLVVLSACETGRGRVGVGEGIIGLSWALFVAGSPTAVVSQWKVESASTTRLMLEFHRNLQSKMEKSQISKAKALQRAAVRMLRSADSRHPFYWAGFILVGDGG